MKRKEELEKFAKQIRLDVIKMTLNSNKTGAHIGGAFSVADILAVLYCSVANVSSANPYDEMRDRIILSKSHAAVALYSALSQVGFIKEEELEGAMKSDSWFFKHPQKCAEYGIECSGGSLGMGLSFGMGMGRALKLKGLFEPRVFVIVGDGECNEGSIWEAASSIVSYDLNNVLVIVDANKLQIDGSNSEVMNMGNLKERWKSVGFEVCEVDGHDVLQLQDELMKKRSKPTVLFCNTVKGKGVSFFENKVEWHVGRLTKEQAEQAVLELRNND